MSTIRAIVHGNTSDRSYSLAAIYAFQYCFFFANWWSLGLIRSTSSLILLGALAAPFIGGGLLYYMGGIYYFTGWILKGKASFVDIRACWASSKSPHVINLLIWIFLVFVTPKYVFIQDSQNGPSSILVNLFTLIIGSWSSVLWVKKLRLIQDFSLFRTIFNILLAWISFFFFSFFIYFAINCIFVS